MTQNWFVPGMDSAATPTRPSSAPMPPSSGKFDPLFAAAGYLEGIDPMVLKAVAIQEGRTLDPAQANASSGAKGLMQLMDPTAASYGVAKPFDPGQSIQGGAQTLRDFMTATWRVRCKDTTAAQLAKPKTRGAMLSKCSLVTRH